MPVSLGSDVATAPVASLGLVGGYLLARESGSRPLGGVVSGLAGAYAVRTWAVRDGALTAAVLGSLYVASLVASHPLAKKVGAWPSVLGAAAFTTGVVHLVSDRRR
ncbi:MAG: hypothetical protein ACR2FV_04805 [Ornithinimicrobium sp.]|uniref:hypothetical protein n=1 Tax=Ornithinimicrobium sp. TaxID=1977084 RepID=UPI003D9B60EC